MIIDKVKTLFRQLNFSSFVMVYILMYMIVPVISVITSRFLTTYFFMVVVVLGVLYAIYSCRLKSIREFLLLLIPFILYQLLEILSKGDLDFLLAGYQALLFILPICLGFCIVKYSANTPFYAVLLAILFFITIITTIIGSVRNPDASRILATVKSSQDPESLKYLWQNIGGYNFVYSFVLLYPCVILAFKLKKLHIGFVIGFVVAAFALVINTGYSLALMFVMVSTLLFFIKKDLSLKKFLLVLIGFILIVILFRTAIAALLTRLGGVLGNEGMMEKINVLFLGKESVENFDDSRDELYLLSLKTFLSNPVFGTGFIGGRGSGGHSFILDNLALHGLLGGGLMVWMYQKIFKVFYLPLSKKPGYAIVVWAFMQAVLLSVVNTGMWLTNLCLYVPVILAALYGGEQNNESALDSQRAFKPVKLLPVSEKD